MKSEKQKDIFFVTLAIYILSLVILNCTIRRNEVEFIMKLPSKVSDDVLTVAIIIGSLVSVFVFVVILILDRFILQIIFKIIYKESMDRTLLNETYFVPLTIKIFFRTLLQFIEVSGVTVKSIGTSLAAIIGYAIYLFAFRKNDVENNSNIIFKFFTGILLIFLS